MQKATSKDWVRDLKNHLSSVINSEPTVTIELQGTTGQCQTERINVDCWADDVFRHGYEGLAAEAGFIVK
jgi:hypothetical protein